MKTPGRYDSRKSALSRGADRAAGGDWHVAFLPSMVFLHVLHLASAWSIGVAISFLGFLLNSLAVNLVFESVRVIGAGDCGCLWVLSNGPKPQPRAHFPVPGTWGLKTTQVVQKFRRHADLACCM